MSYSRGLYWLSWFVPGWVLVVMLAVVGASIAAPPVPPSPTTYVSDEAQALSAGARESLDRRLARYEQQSGHQVIVWIGRTTGGVTPEQFAVEAFEQWKVGQPKLDDGLGVFVFVEDRAIRIEVGYGLEPTVTDLIASQVIRTIMIPKIEQGDWDAAIVGGVEALVDTIEGAPGSLPDDSGAAAPVRSERKMSGLQMIALLIGFVLFMLLLGTNPGLALGMLYMIGRGGMHGGGGGGGGGFSGLGGRSGGGGATGEW